jgi:hypothetical protein
MNRRNVIERFPWSASLLTALCLSGLALGIGSPIALAEPPASTSDDQIAQTVKQLTTSDENLDKLCADLEKLAVAPRESVRLLIAELHPIPRKAYYPGKKPKDERHVVAVLHALRYLTGTTFSAKTKTKLSTKLWDDEEQFLDFNKQMHDENPSHEIHFFGVWMSRNADIFAPEDAQREIIRKWKHWLETDGKDFNAIPKKTPAASSEDWVWYG